MPIDRIRSNTLRWSALACACASAACMQGAALPAIHGQRLARALEDVVRIPYTRDTPPRARINVLQPAPDASHRLFVADMAGIIYVIRDGQLLDQPLLDLRVARKGAFMADQLFEEGLVGFAFHPDCDHQGRGGYRKLYTFSTERHGSAPPTFTRRVPVTASAHDDVIREWTLDRAGTVVDPGSAREVMRIVHPKHDHVGGYVAFNPGAAPGTPDYGKLYIAVGDGGNTVPIHGDVDHWRMAQNRAVPLGKLLRIDPLAAAGRPYTVPGDNPFVRDADALPEIWAYGLRNPERFSWDAGGDHALLIADIGQFQLEEIDVGTAGANYGWSEREGDRVVDHRDQKRRVPRPLFDFASGYTYPALVYGHHLGLAVTGGYVYRGDALPALRGLYVFGDLASGRIFATDVRGLRNGGQAPFYELPLVQDGRPRTLLQIVGAPRADLRFGIDDRGELYVLTKQDGMIRRLRALVPAEQSLWPVDHPEDVLDESLWSSFAQRFASTLEQLGGRH